VSYPPPLLRLLDTVFSGSVLNAEISVGVSVIENESLTLSEYMVLSRINIPGASEIVAQKEFPGNQGPIPEILSWCLWI